MRYRGTDYSVPTAYGHREVLIRGYVESVVIACGAEIIARHVRSYEREDFVFDPLHYLALLERKTGAIDQAAPLVINSVKKGGIVSIVGVYGPTGNVVPIGNVVNKGITIRANQASVKRLLPKLIEHVREGRIEPKKLITHRVPLDDIADAYHIFSAKLEGCIKPVLLPNGA